MSRDALKTLFHPFASGTIDAPGEGERILFLGAEAGFALPEGFAAELSAVQGFRPFFRQLQGQRINVTPEIEGEGYDGALVLCGKHKGENEDHIAEALTRVKEGGLIVVAGGKEDGIQPLRKRIEAFGLEIEHMPKYHGVAFWFARPADIKLLTAQLAKPATRVDDSFTTAPGMFSHDRIDAGSELLASRLPTDFAGDAADFGAGWGYLSVELAMKSPRIERIDLYEAHYGALAEGNVLPVRVQRVHETQLFIGCHPDFGLWHRGSRKRGGGARLRGGRLPALQIHRLRSLSSPAVGEGRDCRFT